MASPAETLAALGRSLQQDLLTSIDVETWPLPAVTDKDLSALANWEIETQAIAAFTADLNDLFVWLTEGLSLSGALQPEAQSMGQGARAESGGRSLPLNHRLEADDAALDPRLNLSRTTAFDVAPFIAPFTGAEADQVHNGVPIKSIDLVRETEPAASTETEGVEVKGQPLNSGDLPQSFAAGEGGQNLPKPKSIRGLADLAKQLDSSSWAGDFSVAGEARNAIEAVSPLKVTHRRDVQASAIATTDSDSPDPQGSVLADVVSLQRGLNAEVATPPDAVGQEWQPGSLERVSLEESSETFAPQDLLRSHNHFVNLPSAELQALAATTSLSPPEGATARGVRPYPTRHPPDWQPTLIPQSPELLAPELLAPELLALEIPGETLPRSQTAPNAKPFDGSPPLPPKEAPTNPSLAPTPSGGDLPIGPDDPNFEDLMSAIAHTITREYHRYYGP